MPTNRPGEGASRWSHLRGILMNKSSDRPAGTLARWTICCSTVLMLVAQDARAVVVFNPNDTVHAVAPTDQYANSGWQYQGSWGSFLGTAISPHHFITAGHVGGQTGNTFTFQGANYTAIQSFDDPASDLRIWQISGTFPEYAPLYRADNEVGSELVVFGRGASRGAEVLVNGQAHGWYWGGSGAQQRWGVNQVSSIYAGEPGLGELLAANFNAGMGPNEAHLSGGDSGGGLFIQDGGVWKLAGINYGVDGPFSFSGGSDAGFNALLFDAGGLYYRDTLTTWAYQPDSLDDIPSAFYATRISAHSEWIDTVIPEPDWSSATALAAMAAILWRQWRRCSPPRSAATPPNIS
jgi:hypothetical protein